MSKPLNWGILNTGRIASCFARNLASSTTGNLFAVASRNEETAKRFAAENNVSLAFGDYEELLQDKNIDAVYISTPHPLHAEYGVKALNAKKHVLIEKPIGINERQVLAMIDAARANDVLLAEAFMYRCHPQTHRLIELLREAAIGEVRSIRATFGYRTPFSAQSRVFSNAMAGGGILDVGCYCVSMARLIAGASTGIDFAEPVNVTGAGHLGTTGVDEWAFGLLTFPGNIIAQVATSVSLDQENVVTIDGSQGRIHLPNPWVYGQQTPENGKIILARMGEVPKAIDVPAAFTSYAYEADVFGIAVLDGTKEVPAPAMTWDDSIGNIKSLDQWRQSIGLVYAEEMFSPQDYLRT